MAVKYSLVLRNARIIDPANRVDKVGDIGIVDGKIASLGVIDGTSSIVEDLSGKACIPGMIDVHTHLSESYLGKAGFADLILEGTTTALDVSGPVERVMDNIRLYGCGMNVAVLNAASPGTTLSGQKASKDEIAEFIQGSLARGAYGVKILGGHFPFDPDTTHDIISATNEAKVHIAFHVGTTASASNLFGLREAVEMSKDCHLQICHVQGHVRGNVLGDTLDEAKEALDFLPKAENVVTEATICELANDHATCVDGRPKSLVVRANLKLCGLEPTEQGLRDGIKKGIIRIVVARNERMILLVGDEGIAEFERAGTNIMMLSPVNPRTTGLLCATAKDEQGHFVVDAISADGGNAPRQVQVRYGLAMVRFGALTVNELAVKISANPARILGLNNKGHLGIGADADVTVLDLDRGNTFMTIVGGKVVMKDGTITGESGRVITTAAGVEAVKHTGLPFEVADPGKGWMYTPRSQRSHIV